VPRKSAAALSVVARTIDRRPSPPSELTEAQAETWKSIVSRLPSDWFPRETWPALVALCRHVDTSEKLATSINGFQMDWLGDPGGIERLDQLLKLRDREHRAMLLIARSLRLTNQSRYPADKASRLASKPNWTRGVPPWDGAPDAPMWTAIP
jgi:hypothetical protein